MNLNLNSFSNQHFDLSTYMILFVLAFLGGLVFRRLMNDVHKKSYTLEHNYVLIPLFTISLMTFFYVLKSSLPLSLGILGSLSIIRFRTPMRDLRDTFLIISMIAFCLLLGTENLPMAGIFLVSCSIIVPVLIRQENGKERTVLINIVYDSFNREVESFLRSAIPGQETISTSVIKNRTYVLMNVPESTDFEGLRNRLLEISEDVDIQYAQN